MTKRKRSFGEKVKQTAKRTFIGRDAIIAHFRKNLELGPESEDFRNIISVHGQGGVGKSTLVKRRYLDMVSATGYLTVFIDTYDKQWYDIPAMMGELARQLDEQGGNFKKFNHRYKTYLQEKGNLETDPERPKGTFGSIITEGLKHGGKLGREAIPGGGIFLSDSMIETFAEVGGGWADFVGRKLTNKDEVQLVLNPVDVLSPLWLKGVAELAEKKNIAFFFDTYEASNPALDRWIVHLLKGQFGFFPSNFLLCISGREHLTQEQWADFEDYIISVSLEPFSEAEATAFLKDKNIHSEQSIRQIISISNCLPVYLSLLSEGGPQTQDELLDPNEEVVAQFLTHIKAPLQKQLALHASLARKLNKDIIACLLPEETPTQEVFRLFQWLRTRPFVKRWAYHPVVQEQMMRYQLQISEKDWEDVHLALAAWYQGRKDRLGIDGRETQFADETWRNHRLEEHFHLLCANYNKQLPEFIRDLASIIRLLPYSVAINWGETVESIEKLVHKPNWGRIVKRGINGLIEGQESEAAEIFHAINQAKILIDIDDQSFFYYKEGNLIRESHPTPAIICYQRAIEIQPNMYGAYNNMGMAYDSLGENSKAIKCYQKSIKSQPTYFGAHNNLGISYRIIGEYDKAMKCFEKTLDLAPNYHGAYNNLGYVWADKGNREKAISNYHKAIELKSDYWEPYFNLGLIYIEEEQIEKAIDCYEKVIEIWPYHHDAYFNLGNAYADSHEDNNAIKYYEKALEIKPNKHEVYNNMGSAYARLGQPDKAIWCYEKAIEIKPDKQGAYNNMGTAYKYKGDISKAIEYYEKAIEIDPQMHEAYFNLGLAFEKLENNSKAIECYQKATTINPDKIEAYFNMANVYGVDGNMEKAIRFLQRVIDLKPNMYEAHYKLGGAYTMLWDLPNAIEAFEHAIGIQAEKYEAHFYLGNAYYESGETDKAIKQYLTVVDLCPDHEQAHFNLANSYIEKEEVGKAIEYYQKTITLNPDHSQAYFELGFAFDAEGMKDKAMKNYQTTIDLKSDHELAWNNLGVLYLEAGELALAETHVRKSIEFGLDSYGYMNLGHVYLAKKDTEQAMDYYRKSWKAFENKDEFWEGMNRDFQLLIQYEVDTEEYQRILKVIRGTIHNSSKS